MKNSYNKGALEIILAIAVATSALLGVFGLNSYKEAKLAEQRYESVLQETYTLGAFRPSNYVGKLLTRLNEGGSESTFNTTPGTAKDGSTLTTAKIGDFVVFTINPGAANEEKISVSAVSVSGTTATWTIINRGLSFTENVAVTANKKQHTIGETVIISNDDHYLNVNYAANDEDETITGSWSFPTPTVAANPATKAYVDGSVFGGIGNASEVATGTVEIATGVEIASSTSSGTLGRLAIPASLATSTYNSATADLKVVVTQNSGKIDNNFIATTSLFTNMVAIGASNIASSSIAIYVATTTAHAGNYTWTKSSNLKYVVVEVVGGGGGGGGNTTSDRASGGGGAGGYSKEILMASQLGSTEAVVVGNGGAKGAGSTGANGSNAGTSSFGSHLQATGGVGGGGSASPYGGSGGVGTGGHLNIGGGGGGAVSVGTADGSGAGGSSVLGGGGDGKATDSNGTDGGQYGGGGSGAKSAGGDRDGGAGATGVVIVTEIYY